MVLMGAHGGLCEPGHPYPGVMTRPQQRSGRNGLEPRGAAREPDIARRASTPLKNASSHGFHESNRYTIRRLRCRSPGAPGLLRSVFFGA
jgi:hypothetical protein